MHPNLKKKLLLAVGILWLLYSLIIIIPGYITSLKSDVAEHAVLSYISAMGWEEEVVSVTGGLMGDANQYPVNVVYHNDELNYDYHYLFGKRGETPGVSAPFVFKINVSIGIEGKEIPHYFPDYYEYWDNHDLHHTIYPYSYQDYMEEVELNPFEKLILPLVANPD